MVSAGIAIGAVALLVTQALLPFMDRWSARERTYDLGRAQWARLQGLVASESRLRQARAQQGDLQRASVALLVAGPTPALAASGLQEMLRRYAEESMLQLERVDVAGQPTADRSGRLLEIPVSLQGQGDIYGLVDFLFRVQHGERLLVVDELTVNAGLAQALAAGQEQSERLLAWSMRAHGLYPLAADGP